MRIIILTASNDRKQSRTVELSGRTNQNLRNKTLPTALTDVFPLVQIIARRNKN